MDINEPSCRSFYFTPSFKAIGLSTSALILLNFYASPEINEHSTPSKDGDAMMSLGLRELSMLTWLTPQQITRANKDLKKLGLIDYKMSGMPARNHYIIYTGEIMQAWAKAMKQKYPEMFIVRPGEPF